MKRSFATFSRVFARSFAPRTVNKAWINLLKASILAGGFYQYHTYRQNYAQCSIFQSGKFNYHSAAKSTIVIYRHNHDEPVAGGIILDETGFYVSIANIYPRVSEDRLNMENYYAKVLGDEKTYALSFLEYIGDDNLALFKLIRRDPDIRFQPAKLSQDTAIGNEAHVIGKSSSDFNLIESGMINETNFNAKTAFGKENDTNSFNIMVNIPNKHSTLFGAPLFDSNSNVLGMVIPYDDRILSTHILATPASFLQGVINQYKTTGRVRRPYLGMSIKSSASGSGAFIIKVNSEGPAAQGGVKLGDTIVEINDQKITNSNDFFKCLEYHIGQDLKMKLERDGKYRVIHITSS